ncbi:4-hydroxy-tetrahydrodipicolinate synthase [Caulobacter sp.]|uniref:4-hydroxy-tetrahydrodipicolinate synthase n=1 Tax=Caulobacter sp. TaxID=78 RepID=UPI003BB06E9A
MQLQGVYTELVTPFIDGRLDEAAVVALIERQLAAHVAGIVVASGAAGEGATLHDGELETLLELAVRVVDGRVSVLSGASSNSTSKAAALARRAEAIGVDAVIVSAPWYNRPSQAGVQQHFEHVAASVSCPILVGDAPSRTGINLQMETLVAISRLNTVVGIVDGSGDMARASVIRRACSHWSLLSGHELSSLGCLAHGASGLVSLTANLTPDAAVAMCRAGICGSRVEAERLQGLLFDLQSAMSQDPAAVKWALARLGYCGSEVRLPIAPWPQQDEGLGGLLTMMNIA